jgi:excisionase family DNA binding protein
MTVKTDILTSDMLGADFAAKWLGVHTNYMRLLIRKGKIRAQRFGNYLAISREELDRYQRERMR